MKSVFLLLAAILTPAAARADFAILTPERIGAADLCQLQGLRLTCIDRDGKLLISKQELYPPEARGEPVNLRFLRAVQMMRNEGLTLSTSIPEHGEATNSIFTRAPASPR